MYLIINQQQGFQSNQILVGVYVLKKLNHLIGVYALANLFDNPQDVVDGQIAPISISTGARISSVDGYLSVTLGPIAESLSNFSSKISPLLDSTNLAKIKDFITPAEDLYSYLR
ncbi:hypothetical protein TAO_0518 [Candidatus Nitrosoglobus terrae]|uniref:Uncharacterized protein n=2 Tax=Candidatus Nitrosoglobus terrae TaxID=1630141 RepID=A0A1Q2SL83_9GAMM|nr:hypothetical protein TAO_0518 [Candidatus Nitrosoglobus terrae]